MTTICGMLPPIQRGYLPQDTQRKTTLLKAGEVVIVDFPGATGIKRRPTVVLFSHLYKSSRLDVILGLITSQITGSMGPTDHALVDWAAVRLGVRSLFHRFLVTLPRSFRLRFFVSASKGNPPRAKVQFPSPSMQRFLGASFLVLSDGLFLPGHSADRHSAKLILAVANSICDCAMIITITDNTEKLGSSRILFRTGVNRKKARPP
jgi:mRNA interferase MazF